MDNLSNDTITLYISKWCAHSMSVEGFLDRNGIRVHKIKIDGDNEARERLIEINEGYASVPTLIFPDGTKLTEPSLSQLRNKLELEAPPGLVDRIRGMFRQSDQEKSD